VTGPFLAWATTGGQSPAAAIRLVLEGEFVDLSNASMVITGAVSGIGPALALRLAEDTPRLTLVGRRQQPVDELADRVREQGGQAYGGTAELTEPGAPQTVVASARAGFGGIDVPVDNAGNVRAGRLEGIEESEVMAQVALNRTAPIQFTRAAQPSLRESERGLVTSDASGIGLIVMRFYSIYSDQGRYRTLRGRRCVVSCTARVCMC